MSRHWRSRTEYKNSNGKIIKMQNISNIHNDVDYYVLMDSEGNHLESSLCFNRLMQRLMSKKFLIEFNASFVRSYKSSKRAIEKAKEFAKDSQNLVRVWSDENVYGLPNQRNIIWENQTEYGS